MALLPKVSDTWVSESQFESQSFLLDRELIEYDYTEFVASWLEAYQQLNQLASLEEDWDGDGASPLDEAILESVGNWLNRLRYDEDDAPTRIVADPDGTVVVEWVEAGSYYEVEFSSPYKGEWMHRFNDEVARHGEFDLSSRGASVDETISGIESRPIRRRVHDATWSSSEYQDVYAATA